MLVVMHVQQLEVQINLGQVLVPPVEVLVRFDHSKASFLLKDHDLHVEERDQVLKIHVLNVLEQGI